MSLKAIELQVALPRTQEIGKVQEQLQQRSQLIHDLAAREMQKEMKKQETTVLKNQPKGNVNVQQEGSSKQHQQFQEQAPKKEEESKMSHPYKGITIDYSG